MSLQGDYNPFLVLLSILIAVFAAYTALNFISRLSDMHSTRLARARVGAGGLVMGLGIWSMHFVAMLAYRLPIPVRYDALITLFSLLVAIFACVLGLAITSRRSTLPGVILGGSVLGSGISSMHYIGMAAMHMPATMQYNSLLVIASVLIGITTAIAALWVAFAIGSGEVVDSYRVKISGAVIMGIAIAGMHYTGMAAMNVYHVPGKDYIGLGFELDPELIGISLTISAMLLMSFALWASRLVADTRIIRANEEKVSAITENVIDVIITINTTGIIEFANAAVEKLLGYQPDELIGQNVKILMPEPFREKHDQFILDYLRHGKGRLIGAGQREMQAIHKNGQVFPIELAVSEALVSGKKIFIGTIRDITERIEVEQRLRYLAHHDALTDLPNRLSFQEGIESALLHARRSQRLVAVLFLDLDRFKVINDTLGHYVGDYLLQEVAQRLQTCVREGDIIARLSGDEFTVLLDDVSALDDIAPIAHKIISAISKPILYSRQELFTTVSIGISIFPDDGCDPATMMQHADIAMYRAKAEGGNNYRFYTPDMNARADEQLKLETSLRHALERNEFILHYQPQVDVENGAVVGVEALLRWQHPEQGLVSPLDFIYLLEETGLIVPVGEWVLREACRQNMAWQSAGLPPMQVAVNLSARQFNENDLVPMIAALLDEIGMAPEYLELEITENILLHQTNHTLTALTELHALGVQLAIDDFGTGYSSLSYLRKFPIHTLKIDRSFIRDISTDADNAAIVQLIIDMGHSLKLNVIAEGVETREQLEYLSLRNCWEMQGFYFSEPRPADDIFPLLGKGFSQPSGKNEQAK